MKEPILQELSARNFTAHYPFLAQRPSWHPKKKTHRIYIYIYVYMYIYIYTHTYRFCQHFDIIATYGCAASANLGRAKFLKKNPNAWAKSAQKPNDRASFHELKSARIGSFQQVGHFFHSFIKYYTFLSKIAKNLMPGHFLPPKT